MAERWNTELACAALAMAMMAIATAPVSFRSVDQFVAFKTAAAKDDDRAGGERVAAGGSDRAGRSDTGQLYAGWARSKLKSTQGWSTWAGAKKQDAQSPPLSKDKLGAISVAHASLEPFARPSSPKHITNAIAHGKAQEAAASAEKTFSAAQAVLDAAILDLATAKATLEAANARLAAARAASGVANSRYEAAKAAHDTAMAAYDADPVNPDLGPALDRAGFDLDEAVGAQVTFQTAVERASEVQSLAVAAHNAAARDKDTAQAKLNAAEEQRAFATASGQWAALAPVSNEARISDSVLDAARDLLGL